MQSPYIADRDPLELTAMNHIMIQIMRPSPLEKKPPLREIVDLRVSTAASQPCAPLARVVAKIRNYPAGRMYQALDIEEEAVRGLHEVTFSGPHVWQALPEQRWNMTISLTEMI